MGKNAMTAVMKGNKMKTKPVIKPKTKKAYEKLDSKALAKVGKKTMSLADKVQLLMDKDMLKLICLCLFKIYMLHILFGQLTVCPM